jgi:hypothetical protein
MREKTVIRRRLPKTKCQTQHGKVIGKLTEGLTDFERKGGN